MRTATGEPRRDQRRPRLHQCTGQLNHLFAFRITPDIIRETGTGSSLAGSLTYRLKYGFLQLNLDDWMWRGSYVRAGMIQTPYVEFEESVYRYRFQGSIFIDREGYNPSSDFGASFRTQFPGGYGEAVAGIYNGEGYTRADPNDQKAFQVRGTLRPLPGPGTLRGLRVSVSTMPTTTFRTRSARLRDAGELTSIGTSMRGGSTSMRPISRASPQPKSIRAGILSGLRRGGRMATLRPTPATGQVRASLEGLLRYDRLEPNQNDWSVKERWIGGLAYWPRMTNCQRQVGFPSGLRTSALQRLRARSADRETDSAAQAHELLTRVDGPDVHRGCQAEE